MDQRQHSFEFRNRLDYRLAIPCKLAMSHFQDAKRTFCLMRDAGVST